MQTQFTIGYLLFLSFKEVNVLLSDDLWYTVTRLAFRYVCVCMCVTDSPHSYHRWWTHCNN